MLTRFPDSRSLWDDWLIRKLLPENHILLAIDQHIDFSFVAEESRDLYSLHHGRPAYAPEQLLRVLFLAYFYNLSDVRVAEELRYNLLYRAFTHFSLDDDTPDDSTLVVFRRRLGPERCARLLDRIVEQARQKGLLEGKRQCVDATVISANAAVQNRKELLRAARRRLFRAWERIDAKTAAETANQLQEEYTNASEPDLATEEKLTQHLLDAVDAAGHTELQSLRDTVAQILSGEGGVTNLIDPDGRWGFKNKRTPFFGYKAHVSMDASGIVTSVQILSGNEHEGEHLPELLEQDVRKGHRFTSVVADKGYDSIGNRNAIRSHGAKPEIPSRNAGVLAKTRFRYRPRKDTFVCPGRKETNGKIPFKGGFLYYFSQTDCQNCPLKTACLGKKETRKRVYLSDRVRDSLQSQRSLRRALHDRKAIERTFGELKQWHGLGRARYRGKWRVAIQVYLTFLVLNAKRLVNLIQGRSSKPVPAS
ncbi:IS1182 family transposase [Alicyclobacillus sendaiensis]|uniref:IS1182 family transposase n=1 Tax=Alicyclobacillus sendaiensis TaxID=192387 RepID=UPI00272C912D|nr:IS1182 family transposase [Alicyclobacillus sendaiensis]